ncbi:hypothetical protein [Massilia sp. erpn]|uniref:hypothetical protein n=1 Tax=Massilia sp. erpn TaxID=2738142 RepID=UPI002102BFF1|nr:hypothetical protein [Massilia sp. erpn]UTY56355.1 hypothetical protein HPQ68_03590 [Massilia sp. erpn]
MHKKLALFVFAAVAALSSTLASASYDRCSICYIEHNHCNGNPNANQETCEENYWRCLQACGIQIP